MQICKKCLRAFGLVILLTGSILNAQFDSQPVDAQANKVLRSVAKYYAPLKSFSVEIDKQTLYESGGVKSVRNETIVFSLQRPNRLSIILKEGEMDSSIFFDGQTMTSYIPSFHQYRQGPAPATFDQIFEQRLEIGAQLLFSIPLIQALITDNPEEFIKQELMQAEMLTSEKIDGKDCHKIRVKTYPFNVHLWVLQGEKPWVMKIASDLLPNQQDPSGRGDRIELRWEFKNWTLNPPLPQSTFAFTPPASAKRVKAFAMPEENDSHPMVGEKASDFTLELLNGGKMNLASHRGKQIVVLDFWAAWCPPCIQALPTLAKVTEKFKNKDVVFYAINSLSRRETPQSVKAFLKQKKLNINVPLDTSFTVSRLYKVSGIPQTVVIDKKGIIRHVQVGVPPRLEQKLTAELTELTNETHGKASQVDLTCQSTLFLPQKIQVGQPVALQFVAGNLGSQNVQAGTHNIRLSIENQLAYAGPADLAINAKGQATFRIPQDIWHVEFTKAGHYNYKLEIDADGHIHETNEENNTCVGHVTVTAIN